MDLTPQERYLYKPFVGSSHSWALSHLTSCDPGSRVLDIGPGSGAIGRELRGLGFTELYAVEIDESARANAASIYKQVEETLQPFAGQKFDIVLMLDVLEHMSDPFRFLKHVSEMLSPRGKIFVSVPNITHWSVRLPFLFGFFEYSERGILDKTHLQFFNRKRFLKLITSQPGLRPSHISSSIEPAEFVLPRKVWDNETFRSCSRVRTKVAEMLPGLFAYQHLAVMTKEG